MDLKLSLTAETKNWMVDYGLYCNKKYRSEMDQIFSFVDEAGKKLNRQIKDLDDIRIAMAVFKEIRESQIAIDFQVGPIEVKQTFILQLSLHGLCMQIPKGRKGGNVLLRSQSE